jgi:hypothetical protein
VPPSSGRTQGERENTYSGSLEVLVLVTGSVNKDINHIINIIFEKGTYTQLVRTHIRRGHRHGRR